MYSPTYGKFRREYYDEEVNQIQQAQCGAGRDPVRGLPQTLRDNPPKRTKRLAGTKYSFNELIQMPADTPAGKIGLGPCKFYDGKKNANHVF